MMRWTILLLLAGLTVCGCASKGETRIDWQSSQPPALTMAKETGDYALYTGADPNARVVEHLKQAERLGFEKNDLGRIRAIAGRYSTDLDPAMIDHARWELMKEQQVKAQ